MEWQKLTLFDCVEPILCVTESIPIFCRDKNAPFSEMDRVWWGVPRSSKPLSYLSAPRSEDSFIWDTGPRSGTGVGNVGSRLGERHPQKRLSPTGTTCGACASCLLPPPFSPLPPADPGAAPGRLQQHLPRGGGGQRHGLTRLSRLLPLAGPESRHRPGRSVPPPPQRAREGTARLRHGARSRPPTNSTGGPAAGQGHNGPAGGRRRRPSPRAGRPGGRLRSPAVRGEGEEGTPDAIAPASVGMPRRRGGPEPRLSAAAPRQPPLTPPW